MVFLVTKKNIAEHVLSYTFIDLFFAVSRLQVMQPVRLRLSAKLVNQSAVFFSHKNPASSTFS
jgi:hypothetical protein